MSSLSGDGDQRHQTVSARDLEPLVAELLLPGVRAGYVASLVAVAVLVPPLVVSGAEGVAPWAVLRVVLSLSLYWACVRLGRRMHDAHHVLRRMELIVGLGAVGWGLLPVMIRPDDVAGEALVISFTAGNLFAVTATSSVHPRVYRAGVLPAAGLALVGVALHSRPAAWTWVLIILAALVYTYIVFRSMHSALIARIHAESSQRELAKQRDLEREAAVHARDQLEVALRQRSIAAAELSVLVTALGHDLSTPLTSATIAADLLETRATDLGDDHRWLVEQIRAGMRRANGVLHDLRGRPSFTSRELDVTRRPVDLAGIVRSVLAEVDASPVAVDSSGVADGVAVTADAALVKRMIDNLVTNALVHASPSRVTISAGRRGGFVDLVVADDGSGVPTSVRSRLFEAHVREDDSPGEGLGLLIVRAFARLQGGDVTHADEPGGGSRFTVTLPAADTAHPTAD